VSHPRRATWLAALVAVAAVAATGFAIARADDAGGVRTIRVTIRYSSFSPSSYAVASGETVRFVVENRDPIDHEFILGDRTVQALHERGTEAYHPPRPGEMTVPAGQTRTTIVTFGAPSTLIIGCHLPGHYAYGMRAPVVVT
jgi:uncharacterized cupredoxin-like copper-binding protein